MPVWVYKKIQVSTKVQWMYSHHWDLVCPITLTMYNLGCSGQKKPHSSHYHNTNFKIFQ